MKPPKKLHPLSKQTPAIARRFAAAIALSLLLPACGRDDALGRASSQPPPPSEGDFPAFGNGGALHNLAPDIAPPPMKVRWTFKASDAITAAPIIVHDAVYIADSAGDLVALELAGGGKRWTFHSPAGFDATPLITGQRLYIGDLGGTFFAIDTGDGNQIWSVNLQSAIHAGANADGNRLLVGTDEGMMLCLDDAGQTLWKAQAEGRINAPPAILNGIAAFTSCDAHLRAIRISDGRELFKTDLAQLAPGSACASADSLFVGTDQGRVLALSAEGGLPRWHFDKIADQAMVYASPALSQNTLIIAARDNHIYALDTRDGTKKWSFATGAGIDASPVISAGRVYIPSKDRRLYVLNLADGKSLWTFEAARQVTAPVAIGRGVLVMADAGGTVYCLEPQ